MAALAVVNELQWLKDNPHFEERPASILEFVGEGYLEIEKRVRKEIMACLVDLFGEYTNTERIALYQLAMLTGGIGIGKAQPIDTPTLTPRGWVPMGTLRPGDAVIGSNGEATKVVGVFPQGMKKTYRITTTDGASTLACEDHLWRVHHFKKKSRGGASEVLSVREILKKGLRNSQGQRLWQVPVAAPVNYAPHADLPVPPYTVGALLGDGGMTQGSVRFSTLDKQILDRIADETGIPPKHVAGCDWAFTTDRGKSNPLLTAVRDLGMCVRSELKRVPAGYLVASIEDRRALLAGLMDADGYQNGKLNHTSFCSASKGLTEDVVTLVRSLGGIATKPKFKSNECLGSWGTTIKLPWCPFYVERKASLWTERTANPAIRSIDSIEPAGMMENVCIAVEAADHLYVTEDFLVTHNTTIASIILPYMAHWVLCLKDPQEYFDLLPGSRIAFMQMSTSEAQAKEVVFGDIKARINHSPWFTERYPYSKDFKNQLRFEKDIWILPGDSAETTFEGYNILGGILDEADSHKVTKVKDYAEQGFTSIYSRITSRFHDNGFMLVIGQMKKANGFAAKKYTELKSDPKAYTKRMAIWESFGWDHYLDSKGERDSFFYDAKRKEIIHKAAANAVVNVNLIEVPMVFLRDFENNPEKALRDLAGIPPAVGDPFISLTYKIDEARDRWMGRFGINTPYIDGKGFLPEFRAKDTLKRVCHIDLAYSGDGDALGFAMGHVREMVETEDGERKPYIVIDCLVRLQAGPGQEIFLGDIRRLVYDLRDERGFKIVEVTLDGFQSTDTKQQFIRRRINCEHLSVDKTLIPYYDLRDALYENRIEFPKYEVGLRVGDTDKVEILLKELSELEDNGNKIDHPPQGSKDVADAVAGVVSTLMGDRTYHRKVLHVDPKTGKPETPRMRQDGSLVSRLPARAPAVDRSFTAGATLWRPPTGRPRP